MPNYDSRAQVNFGENEYGGPSRPPVGSSIGVEEFERCHTAYLRYGSYEDGEFRQGRLRIASEPVPEDAVTCSTGVYFLRPEQEDRLHDGVPAKQIQSECEEDGRVAHAVVAESDALEETGVEVSEVIDWLTTFAEDWVGVDDYQLYYSGNRSIHLHTDAYVPPDGLDFLEEQAERFNEEHGADLDTGIYKPKGQFRIVGAEHQATGFYKVEVEPGVDRTNLVRQAQEAPDERRTFHSLPEPHHHATREPIRASNSLDYASSPTRFPTYRASPSGDIESLSPIINREMAVEPALPPEFEGRLPAGYIKAKERAGVNGRHHGHEDEDGVGYSDEEYESAFSPYAKSGEGSARSVMVMEQTGRVHCRRSDQNIYVPARIEYAVGGGDGSFTRKNSESLVRLSPRDYRKWEYEPGDTVLLIGGRSGSSRIFSLCPAVEVIAATKLELDGRQEALNALAEVGLDVRKSDNPERTGDGVRTKDETTAERIKRQIDAGELEPTYSHTLRVSCRLLRIEGWDAALEWCRDVFGDEFDREETYWRLREVVESYSDYSHVEVPA